jgi:folate-dependent tRNA-U54 methylase TrmFO/GidA
MGALINHITGGHIETIDEGPRSFQPMNINFGLFPPIGAVKNETGKAACAASWPASARLQAGAKMPLLASG